MPNYVVGYLYIIDWQVLKAGLDIFVASWSQNACLAAGGGICKPDIKLSEQVLPFPDATVECRPAECRPKKCMGVATLSCIRFS